MTVAALATGSVLLVAASLKLIGWNVSPFAQYGWLLSPTVQAVAIIWETLLGIWLLSRKNQFLAWLAAVVTFTTFAVVSGYLGIIGQATCGCFGVVRASPWAAFTLDTAALTVLGLGRPAWPGCATVASGWRWATGMGALLALFGVVSIVVFGSFDAALANLRGEQVVASPAAVDFGGGTSGQTLTATVTVRNYSGQPIRLIGGTSDCWCLAAEDLPQTIPAGGSTAVRVRLHLPETSEGQISRWLELRTDSVQFPTLRVSATARVTPGGVR